MSKKTIVMIHGFRGTNHGLRLIADELKDFEVIIPDLPGFGEGQPMDVEHSIENYTKWLHGYIKNLQLKQKPILLGHSFGSIVAASYAAKHPETITRLILENPIGAPALEGPRAVFTKLAIFYYWLGRKLPSGLARLWLASSPSTMLMSIIMAKTKDRDLRKFIHKQHLTYFSTFSDPETLNQAFKASVTSSVRDFAPKIKLQTLLIVGERDDITTLEKQEKLTAMFANAKLDIIKDVGHLTHYETPDQVAQLIQDFTKDL